MTHSATVNQSEPRLHVESRGRGPCVVLMHGFGGSARNLRPQARALETNYRTICFDARGHARSQAPTEPGNYTADRFVHDVERVLDMHGERQAVIGGISMGAGIALRFAQAWPERTRALVLAAYPAAGTQDWARNLAEEISERGMEAAGERWIWGPGSRFDSASAALVRRGFSEHSPGALVAILRELLASNPWLDAAELGRIRVPCCIVVGSEDHASIEVSHQLARLIAGSELHVIEGAGHTVNLADAVRFNAVLVQFLKGLDH